MLDRYIGQIEVPISAERLEAYRPHDASNFEMIVNYYWNVRLCEALYPTLNAAEISLRNSVHTALANHFENNRWFDNRDLVGPKQFEQVRKAHDKLRSRRRPRSAGRIVAELNFGFWVGMLNRPYERKVWSHHGYTVLRDAFPHAPRRARRLWFLRDRFFAINKLRNRVFHYEPVWKQPNLARTHTEILEAIAWISPAKRNTIALFDRFPDIYHDGSIQTERELANHLAIR